MKQKPFELGSEVNIGNLYDIASFGRQVKLNKETEKKLSVLRKNLLDTVKGDKPVYGINTGFGEFANTKIPSEKCRKLQTNLILSHACGCGQSLSDEEIRGIMFLRANELAKGHSGVRPCVVKILADFLNKSIIPFVPSRGSVGASGDLVPLAHIALCLMGKGMAKIDDSDWQPTAKILKKLNIKPIDIHEKEGLSLTNGTQAMQSVGGLTLFDSFKLLYTADLISAVSVEALKGTSSAFERHIHKLKPHYGQIESAEFLLNILKTSGIRKSHGKNDNRVQDSYSLRCIPQVHGSAWQAIDYAAATVETEMQSITDNPIVTWGANYKNIKITSGGNFHGQAISMAFDFAGLALTVLGNISERRTFKMLSSSEILPPFLADEPGTESGLMILQYTAASLASENKTLAHPASADSIPTSAGKEDFVSMGMWAANKLTAISVNVSQILAIELLTACKALEFHRPLKSSSMIEKVYEEVRTIVPKTKGDKSYSEDIEVLSSAILEGVFCI